METLKSSGLNLRTISPKEYGQLIEDLQYNFTQLLNLPGFKGMPGQSVTGETGIGVRGSKWVFVTLNDIQASYPSITSIEQINLVWVNSVFNDDPTKFFDSLYIPGDNSLLVGDILVLPSGQLIELSEVTVNNVTVIQFTDTGITFAQIATITESRVVEIFNQLYGNTSESNSALRHYKAVAKNGADSSPALNTNLNQDSAIDIVVTGSGPGAALPNHTFVAATEQAVGLVTKMCLIAGSAKRYHELIQATQTIHTNNYAPGVDDFSSAVFLQTSNNNGIIFGSAEAESIRQFGRLYRSVDSTVLTSSYSPFESEFSELRLYDQQALIRALKATINVTTMDVLAGTYNSNFFSFTGNVAKLADRPNASLDIYAPGGVSLKNIVSANFLSTDANGKIAKTYSLINTLSGSLNTSQIVDALTIQNALTGINNSITTLTNRVTLLEGADTSKYFQKLSWQTATNFNNLVDNGNYVIMSGQPISNFIPGVATAPTEMIVNSFVSSIESSSASVRVLQEVTMSGATEFANYMNGIKWFRIGSKSGSGAWSFTLWSKIVTGIDKVQGDGDAIVASGSFNTSNMKLSHKAKVAGLNNSSNSGTSVINNLSFDNQGHVTGYSSVDVNSASIKYTWFTLTSWNHDRRYTLAHNISGPAQYNIITGHLFLECLSPEAGYQIGDIVPATDTTPQDSGRTPEGGAGLTFRTTGPNVWIAVGDVIWIRNGSGSPTVQNDVLEINKARWRFRVVLYYV